MMTEEQIQELESAAVAAREELIIALTSWESGNKEATAAAQSLVFRVFQAADRAEAAREEFNLRQIAQGDIVLGGGLGGDGGHLPSLPRRDGSE